MELKKFTTKYNPHQDRLCIDGQSARGEVVSLWLTYRLMRHLIPLLINLVTPAADAQDKASTLAEWAMSSAKAQQKPEAAVTRLVVPNGPRADAPTPVSWLVSSVELKSSPKRAILVFSLLANKPVATIELSPEHLRQWLSIVYRLWVGAGWPTNEWPAWVKETEKPATPQGAVLH